jgi:hypothetical protein
VGVFQIVLSKLDFEFADRSCGSAACCAEGLYPSGGHPLDGSCFRYALGLSLSA